jgi:esterase/lipase
MENIFFRRVTPGYDPEDLPSFRRDGIYVARLLKTKRAILFFHGAGSDIGYNFSRIKILREAGYSVYVPEYPGYGHSTEKASFEGLCRAGKVSYLQAIEDGHEEIIILGYSLGSIAACYLASLFKIHLVVLLSSFPSILDLAEKLFTTPQAMKICKKLVWNNGNFLKEYTGKLLMIHGKYDAFVPIDLAQKLFNTADKVLHKKFVIQEEGHNFKKWDKEVIPFITSFLSEVAMTLSDEKKLLEPLAELDDK